MSEPKQVQVTHANRKMIPSRTKNMLKNAIGTVSKINPAWAVDLGLKTFFLPINRKKRNNLMPEGVMISHRTFNGKKITVYRYGHSLQKILLLHGWEGAASDFAQFFVPFKESGYEVIAVDWPGHGNSPLSALNAIMAAGIIKELEIKYGPFSGIIGHSFGAFATGYALTQYPVLANVPFVSIGSPNKLRNILNNFARFLGYSNVQKEYAFAKVEQKLSIRISDIEHGRFLSLHNGPTMVVHDKYDSMVPVTVIDEIMTHTKEPQFVITEGLGHNRILRDQQTIQKIVQFIEGNQAYRERFDTVLRYGVV